MVLAYLKTLIILTTRPQQSLHGAFWNAHYVSSQPQAKRLVRPAAPNASTRSLRMPAEQGLPPLTPTSRRWPVAAVQRQDKLTPQRRPLYASIQLTLLSFLTPTGSAGTAIFHAVAATIDGDDLRMMQEPVEQRRGEDLISQQTSPGRKAGIGGKPDRAVLIAGGD